MQKIEGGITKKMLERAAKLFRLGLPRWAFKIHSAEDLIAATRGLKLDDALLLVERFIVEEAALIGGVSAGIRGAWALSGHNALRGIAYYFTTGQKKWTRELVLDHGPPTDADLLEAAEKAKEIAADLSVGLDDL